MQSGIDSKRELIEPPTAKPNIIKNPADWGWVQKGMVEVVNSGTGHGINDNFPYQIAGKTGTAQKIVTLPGYTGERDQSWWCGYGPSNDAKIVVCAVIENGGEGGSAAAPAAERVFAKFFNDPVPPTYYHPSD